MPTATAPSNGKTVEKTGLQHFVKGHDPRRGVGKKGRSGRKPDWLKAEMAKGREKAVGHLVTMVDKDKPDLDPDQMLKLVKEWAPPEDSQSGVKVTVHANGSVTIATPGGG